jgi:hypothetical protein
MRRSKEDAAVTREHIVTTVAAKAHASSDFDVLCVEAAVLLRETRGDHRADIIGRPPRPSGVIIDTLVYARFSVTRLL